MLAATTLLVAAVPAAPQATGSAIELSECRINAGPAYPGIKARCGTLERPLDPQNPDGEKIELFVAVVPALSLEPQPDPLVPIAGGPGQASTDFYAAQATAFESIRRERDIVLVDQRGTGQSAPLTCDIDDSVVQGRMTLEQTRIATEECLAVLPHDPRFFTTSVAVADIEALRIALGYPELNLYGISYGTRVAQHFARRYPEATRSVILDGVVPPQIALGPEIATEAQRALDTIFDRCAEDKACDAQFPDLASRFAALEAEVTEEAKAVTLPNPVTGEIETISFGADELAGSVRLLSYHPSTIALIPFLIDQAVGGNLQPLGAQYLMISSNLSDALSIGMHNAVMCTEDAPFFSGEAISDEDLARTYIGPVLLDALVTMCSVWPAGVLDDEFKRPLATERPVLLLSGGADPITPPRYAEMAAVDLSTAYLHTSLLQGHGLAPRGCVGRVMADFITTPTESPLDDDCLERLHAMPFFLDFSGPAP